MAHLILLRNPLTPHEKEEHELQPGETPIEWLQKHHPNGFGMPIKFYLNADEKPLDDLDQMPDHDDIVIIALMPGGFLAAMPLLVKVIIGLAVMAASFFAMQLFAPKAKKQQKQKEPIDSYSIDGDQNAAKYGDPIPVVYGDVWMTPDYVSQPYTWYQWNEANVDELLSGIQFLDVIMCVGHGTIDVTDVKVGSSNASTLGNAVSWAVFQPWQHNSSMGVIKNGMGGQFFENVITCPDVDNQEFISSWQLSQFFTVCKAGTVGQWLQIDIIFPNGLYIIKESGSTKGSSCSMYVYWQEVDDNGNLFGTIYNQKLTVDTRTVDRANTKNAPEITNPVRRTFTIDAGKKSRWAVRVQRIDGAPSPDEGMSTFVWSGLKMIADDGRRAYGNVTLLAVRVKASRGIGSDAAVRISARCKRNQWCLPNGVWGHTTSPADAFYDVYTNSEYGAGRPISELDMPQLSSLKTKWAGYPFNYVFREKSTVWEALKTITVGHAAEPLPLGSTMSIAQDGIKNNRSMLFTDANIVEGSMKLNYIFDIEEDYDGIEVQYTSPLDWRESFARYPANSVIPEAVVLAGCTNATHAMEYARLVWQRTRKQRKRISFETELEGIILQLGDRVAVSHELPKWGASGLVIGYTGNEVVTDQDLDWTGSGHYMIFRLHDGTPSDLIPVTQGRLPHIAIVGAPINFAMHVEDDYDFTSFAFGKATTIVKDFTVATTKHNGERTVLVEAVNYAPEIFDGAMTFLRGS